MKHIKKVIKQIICILLILSLSGCWNAHELDELGIVMGFGMDKPQNDPDKVQLTAQLYKPKRSGSSQHSSGGGGSGGGGDQAYWNITVTEDTVFEAVREMTAQSSRKLFIPHAEALVIGRSAAEAGIERYLDFFQRDHEVRSKITIVISETTAKDVLDVKPELHDIPSLHIAELVQQHHDAASDILAVKLSDFTDSYMSGTMAATAPMIKIVEDGDEKTLEVSGTAVFKMDKMVGTLDRTEGRGLLWVLGKIKSGIIVVKDSLGKSVSAEIIRAKVKVKPILEDGKITIQIDVFEEGNIGEADGTKNLTDLAAVIFLETKIEEAIQNEISAALKKAQELDADIFGFGEAVKRKYPKEWKEMELNWDELFENIKVELKVDAKLRLSGKISNPMVPKKG